MGTAFFSLAQVPVQLGRHSQSPLFKSIPQRGRETEREMERCVYVCVEESSEKVRVDNAEVHKGIEGKKTRVCV